MAWPSNVVGGQGALASDFNGLVSALQVWGGNVSAADYSLFDLLGLGLHTGNAGWQEFRLQAVAGGAPSSDVLALQANARTDAGGSDAWGNVLTVSTAGALTIAASSAWNGAVTFGAGVNLNGQTLGGAATFSGALIFNGALTLGNAVTFSSAAAINFGGNWQSWAPSVTGGGSMTVSVNSVNLAQYLRIGPIVHFELHCSITLGGTASNVVLFTLPAALALGPGTLLRAALDTTLQYTYFNSLTQIGIIQQSQANYALGPHSVQCSGSYRVA